MTLTQSRHQRLKHYGFVPVPSADVPTAGYRTGSILLLNLAWVETLTDQEFEGVLRHEWGHRYVERTIELACILKRSIDKARET